MNIAIAAVLAALLALGAFNPGTTRTVAGIGVAPASGNGQSGTDGIGGGGPPDGPAN